MNLTDDLVIYFFLTKLGESAIIRIALHYLRQMYIHVYVSEKFSAYHKSHPKHNLEFNKMNVIDFNFLPRLYRFSPFSAILVISTINLNLLPLPGSLIMQHQFARYWLTMRFLLRKTYIYQYRAYSSFLHLILIRYRSILFNVWCTLLSRSLISSIKLITTGEVPNEESGSREIAIFLQSHFLFWVN